MYGASHVDLVTEPRRCARLATTLWWPHDGRIRLLLVDSSFSVDGRRSLIPSAHIDPEWLMPPTPGTAPPHLATSRVPDPVGDG